MTSPSPASGGAPYPRGAPLSILPEVRPPNEPRKIFDHAIWRIGEIQLLRQEVKLRQEIANITEESTRTWNPVANNPLLEELQLLLSTLTIARKDWQALHHKKSTRWTRWKVWWYEWSIRGRQA